MVTGRKKGAAPAGRPRIIFLGEWMDSVGLTDEALAEKLGVSRNTVWRWRSGERRLYLETLELIAEMMGMKAADLYRRPGRRSVDAILDSATPKQIDDVIDFANRFVLRDQ